MTLGVPNLGADSAAGKKIYVKPNLRGTCPREDPRGSGPREDHQRVRSLKGRPGGQVRERTPRGSGPGEDHQKVRS